MEMEKKLIRFAKVHGYLTAALTMCSGIVLIVLLGFHSSSRNGKDLPLYLIVCTSIAVVILIGTLSEDASWFKPVKRVFIVSSIGGSLGLIFGHTLDSSFPLSAWFVILAMSLYGFYVLHFLKDLFTDLERRKRPTIVTITAIVCESQPAAAAAPEQSQPVLPAQEQDPSVSSQPPPPPSYEQTVASKPDETGKPREFPTWT